MKRPIRGLLIPIVACVAGFACVPACRAEAPATWCVHLEGGVGLDRVRPMTREETPAAMVSAGVALAVRSPVRVALEGTMTGGNEINGIHYPDTPRPGKRALFSLLIGPEFAKPLGRGSAYAFAGAGLGRVTLRDASNGTLPVATPAPLPEDRTAFALGGALGYRFAGALRPSGWQLGLRMHAIEHDGSLVAWAGSFTVGWVH